MSWEWEGSTVITQWDRTGKGLGIISLMSLRNVQMEVLSNWTYYPWGQCRGLGQRNNSGCHRLGDGD